MLRVKWTPQHSPSSSPSTVIVLSLRNFACLFGMGGNCLVSKLLSVVLSTLRNSGYVKGIGRSNPGFRPGTGAEHPNIRGRSSHKWRRSSRNQSTCVTFQLCRSEFLLDFQCEWTCQQIDRTISKESMWNATATNRKYVFSFIILWITFVFFSYFVLDLFHSMN